MGDGFTGSGRSYRTVPRRTESPVIYAEGENPQEVIDFFSSLSEESTMYVEDYNDSMLLLPGDSPTTGENVAEGLQFGEDEGYVFALYNGEGDVEQPLGDAEMYAAFSDTLPRSLGQRIAGENPRMVNGTRVVGEDESLNTEQLWREARRAGIDDSRSLVKFDKAFRSVFGHQLG